jgi:hypothetical protein
MTWHSSQTANVTSAPEPARQPVRFDHRQRSPIGVIFSYQRVPASFTPARRRSRSSAPAGVQRVKT